MLRRNLITEMGAIAQAETKEESVEIPATLWGSSDDIDLRKVPLPGHEEPQLCVNFCAEGGYAGGRVRVQDIIDFVAKYHPDMLPRS